MAFDPGEVVLVPFPYRDQAGEKARPAVVLSGPTYNARGDLVLAAVTSQRARFSTDYELVDWKAAGLIVPSTVRMLIATTAVARILLRVGRLTAGDWVEVRKRLDSVFV